MPEEYWPKDAGYLEAKIVINNLSVVNDGAERGGKLSYDYIGSSKKEDSFKLFCKLLYRTMIPAPLVVVQQNQSRKDIY